MLVHHRRYLDPTIHAMGGSLATRNADIWMCWNRLLLALQPLPPTTTAPLTTFLHHRLPHSPFDILFSEFGCTHTFLASYLEKHFSFLFSSAYISILFAAYAHMSASLSAAFLDSRPLMRLLYVHTPLRPFTLALLCLSCLSVIRSLACLPVRLFVASIPTPTTTQPFMHTFCISISSTVFIPLIPLLYRFCMYSTSCLLWPLL